jgi:tetratricopeptide (TPR) repeat protein
VQAGIRGLIVLAASLAMALSLTPTARAQTAPAAGGAVPAASPASDDRAQLVQLTAEAAGPDAPAGSVQFEATVNYQLASSAEGFLLAFIFEDDSRQATQSSAHGQAVTAGPGTTTLSVSYVPRPETLTLTLLIGLFRPDEKLLAWTATNPVSLEPAPGRSAFANAMAARLGGNHATAVDELSKAIELAPETSAYYYWRADSEIRLGQYDDAVRDYTRALDLRPGDRASMVGRGVAYLWKQSWQQAIAELTPVIQATSVPDAPAAWAFRARGFARASLGQRGLAVADLREYLTIAPEATDRAEVDAMIAELTATS